MTTKSGLVTMGEARRPLPFSTRFAVCVVAAVWLAIHPGSRDRALGEEGWIRDWLVVGPFQTGGFSMVAPFYETMRHPNAWETYTDEWAPDRRWDVTWRPYRSPTDDVDFDLKETFAGRPAMDWPPGWPGSAYAHLYITVSGQRDALLDFRATSPARVWLNGRDLSQVRILDSGVPAEAGYHPGHGDAPCRRPVTLNPGVNRLLLKLYFPQKDFGTGLARPTRFRVRLLDVDGSPLSGLRYDLNNPQLHDSDRDLRSSESAPQAGSCLSDLTEVTVASKRPRFVFYTGQRVRLATQVQLLPSEERLKRFKRDENRYDPHTFAGRLSANLMDYEGRVVARQTTEMEYGLKPYEVEWEWPPLPEGHYTLYCWVHLRGKLLTSPLPTMISVVDRPHSLRRGVHSKFAHSYYYLGRAEPEFMEVLAAGGVRLNIGSMHWWWLSEDPIEWAKKPTEKRRWEYTPTEKNLAAAETAGVEMTGDLGGCFTAEFKKSYYGWYEIPKETRGRLVVINPYWPTYTYDSPEFATLVCEYVVATVSKYKKHFRYWKLQNEVNLVPGMTPEMWGHIVKAIYQAAKEADPRCIVVNASMSGNGVSFLEPLFQQSYDRYFDVIDYHVYAWPFYDPVERMSGLEELLELMAKYGVRKLLWNGEFGAYRSLWEDGARAQASAWARYMVVAHTYDQLERVGAHFHDANGWGATSDRGQFPAYVAYRVCADNLEGATHHERLNLGPQLAAYRFNQSGDRVTVIWTRNGKRKLLDLHVRQRWVRVIGMLGKERLALAQRGTLRVPVTGDPVYIRERQADRPRESKPEQSGRYTRRRTVATKARTVKR